MRLRVSTAELVVIVIAALGAASPAPAQEQPSEPLDVGLEEEVDVRLVLVDFIVLDRKDRTVPDLTIDDFVVVADHRQMRLASLDLDCPIGAARDALPGKKHAPTQPIPPMKQPRQLVLVFDYYHMESAGLALDGALGALDKWASDGDEHMVLSLGQVARVETPFTADLDEVRWAIKRMRNDPDLYAGNYSRLTETRYYDRIRMLFDVMTMIPGRKMMVLFSGPFMPDGFSHDPAYKELSALATVARTSIYAVDTGGLRVLTDPRNSRLGGPPKLRRLAVDTGGRMTADTNEIGVAYAKAQRDLSCTYTLGFYDDRPRLDRERRITIRVKDRDNVRVVYPEFYKIRSPEEKQKSLFRTAAMLPQMFESNEMTSDLFVIGPHSGSRWNAVVAIRLDLDDARAIEPGEEWLLKGVVRRTNGTVMHSFKRRVPMPPTRPGEQAPAVNVFHTLRMRAGRYIVSAVLKAPEGQPPLASSRPVELARIPRGEPFLIGPILGRSLEREDPDNETRHARHPHFEPLIEAEAAQGDPLETLTLVCLVRPNDPVDSSTVHRAVHTREGLGAQSFDPVSFRLPGGLAGPCRELIDVVETASLEPGRYEMTATAETSDLVTGSGSVEFTIAPKAGN